MIITGVGPTPATFPRDPASPDYNPNHSPSGRITALVATTDGSRLYAGSYAGVWRSDDGGLTWAQLIWPQPSQGDDQTAIPGALFASHVLDMALSPSDADVVLVSAGDSQFLTDSQYPQGRDGVYRTADAGASWTLVLPTPSNEDGPVVCNVVFAPDDSTLAYAAAATTLYKSSDGGITWNADPVVTSANHVAVGPLEPDGARRVYVAADGVLWYSTDGGNGWTRDQGVATINAARQALDALRMTDLGDDIGIGTFARQISYTNGAGPGVLAVEPGNPAHVYLATEGAANGPSLYDTKNIPDGQLCNAPDGRRFAGEASLWLGDYSQFSSSNTTAQWTQLPGPPLYFGITTPSGNTFVATKPTSTGFLVFFSDNSHLHVCAGTPATNSWHRLDGQDASAANQAGVHSNVVFVHVDPHAIAFTNNFEITLIAATGGDPTYNLNTVLDPGALISGIIWMANDGGVTRSLDAGQSGRASWSFSPGIETLDPVNIAGLFGLGSVPALYMGCGDNNDFFSRDGGQSWGDPGSNCGDCDGWFTDTAQPGRVIQFLPRQSPQDKLSAGVIGLITSSDTSQYPDASDAGSKTFIPSTQMVVSSMKDGVPTMVLAGYASSLAVLRGYRPLIETLATEAPLPDGDFITIDQALDTGDARLLRTTSISAIITYADWADPAKASQIGPTLPQGVGIAQASGGHANPVYYVADTSGNLYKLGTCNPGGLIQCWNQIVPVNNFFGVSVQAALSWFVDPYDPDTIYVLDQDGMKVSPDGGSIWLIDFELTNAITAGGKLAISASLLKDMLFFSGERQTRFVLGTAGVSCSMDFGVSWFPVLNSIAFPGRPESGFFDPLSDQYNRTLYVECEGRSVLSIAGLPDLPPFAPDPPPPDLLEFAAIDF